MPALEHGCGGLGNFSMERTTELLEAAKKSNSRVDEDPLAHLVRLYPEAFAAPVLINYNETNNSGYWPTNWKKRTPDNYPKNSEPY